jgi:hypothetical protein
VPYGVNDLTADAGWVSVGTNHDTAAFAAESIRRWWKTAGHGEYPLALSSQLRCMAQVRRCWPAEVPRADQI